MACSLCVTSRPPTPIKKRSIPPSFMLFSCSATRVISLACFYDHRVAVSTPSNPFYCLSSSRLLPYLPFFSLLHTSITQCVHVCIIPNPTQPSPPKPCLALHPPSSSSRHHVATGAPAPAPPPAVVVPKTNRLVLLFNASIVCSVVLPFSFSSRLILTAAAVNPMLKAKTGSKNLRRPPIFSELLFCCFVL